MIALIKIEELVAALVSATGHDAADFKRIIMEHARHINDDIVLHFIPVPAVAGAPTCPYNQSPPNTDFDSTSAGGFESFTKLVSRESPPINVLGGVTVEGFRHAVRSILQNFVKPDSIQFYLTSENHAALLDDISTKFGSMELVPSPNLPNGAVGDMACEATFEFEGVKYSIGDAYPDWHGNSADPTSAVVTFIDGGSICSYVYRVVPTSDLPRNTCKGFHSRKLQRAADYIRLNNDPFYQNNLRKQDMLAAYEQSNFDKMLERNVQTAIAVMEQAYTAQRMSKKNVPTSVLVNMESVGGRTLANGFTIERELNTTGSIETNATSELSRIFLRDYVQTLRGYRIWL